MILHDKDTFLIVSAVSIIVCILMIFFSVLTCCLVKEKKSLGSHLTEQQELIKGHSSSVKNLMVDLEEMSKQYNTMDKS
jgi:hypothetical protein